ncbi:ketopantoate reductase PanE/ApbA C terminal-domain-containing protein [Protomyces lactucae-debilis]|uniref:2-dehydropantoate 2-reductase n=1 Tax=Protomyces lactucae-debilis TaxID=2754530 RepID=A0A1Y2FDN1_PROLT|nr:ketopantoate reductase PanE/ApbA C terminal-domain-containing protein [Protomyces lactucae-debilis]ORY82032.1 ketopantoate reductase PanE/ApbA C terminal-domain-containing protein [Protomyces lactucae-debilis]
MHVIGLGSIGHLVAHHLRARAGLTVTLLLRNTPRNAAIKARAGDYQVSVKTGDTEEHSTGYRIELVDVLAGSSIDTLLVCTKAYDCAAAVRSVMQRLNGQSRVLLMNNGLGVTEELESLWKTDKKPRILEAILTHGVYGLGSTEQQSRICHAGIGEVTLSSDDLAEPLASLNTRVLDAVAFRKAQLTKFVVNCCVNPLTAIHGCYNGQVTRYASAMQFTMQECLTVLACAYPTVPLDAATVQAALEVVISKTANNRSSMLQDVSAGRPTEVAYLNERVCVLGNRFSIPTPTNAGLCQQVRAVTICQSTPR